MSGTGMLLCPVDYDGDNVPPPPQGAGPEEQPPASKRRQFIHCQWAPSGVEGDAEPGVIGTVGLSDDRGFFQLLRLGTNESSFFRVGTGAQVVHAPPPQPTGSPLAAETQSWDARPWSQFAFVPGGRGAVVFLQWQSNTVMWARVSTRRAQPVARLGAHEQRVRVVAVDEAGAYAASGSDDGAVKLWGLDSLSAEGAHPAAHHGAVTALHFRGTGKHLFSAGSDQRVCWWDVASGTVVAEFRTHASPLLELVCGTPREQTKGDPFPMGELYGGHADGTLAVWSLDTKDLIRSSVSHAGSSAAVLSVGVAPGGDLVVLGQLDGTLGAHKAGGTEHGPQVAGEIIGQCALSSAVVCVGFQPPHQKGVVGDAVNHQLLCVCCREGVQFWSTAHLLSRVTHPAEEAANTHQESLDARRPIGARAPPTPARTPVRSAVTEDSAAAEEEPPRPQTASPPPTAMPAGATSGPFGTPARVYRRPTAVEQSLPPQPTAQTEEEDYEDYEEEVAEEQYAAAAAPQMHSAAATPVASPERAFDEGEAALAARRALAKAAPSPFATPRAANFGNPVVFASVLVANHQQNLDEEEQLQQAQPALNSTARLAAKLEAAVRERPAAAAVAKVRAAARVSPSLVNFGMDDRKYGCLTPLKLGPDDEGPTADLPPVRVCLSHKPSTFPPPQLDLS